MRLQSRLAVVSALLLGGLIAMGCGENDDAQLDAGSPDSGGDQDAGLASHRVTGTVTVPNGFAATPVTLGVFFVKNFSQTDFLNAGIGDPTIAATSLVAGQPFGFSVTAVTLMGSALVPGDYYVGAMLFVAGGGTPPIPAEDVDYAGVVDTPITIGQGAVDVGNIELVLFDVDTDSNPDTDFDTDFDTDSGTDSESDSDTN